jgi:hypothetical protein
MSSIGPATKESWSLLFGALKELRTSWPSRGWSWDGHLSCVTSSFSAELDTKARTAAAFALSREWTSTTIQRAPPLLCDLAERTGGLRPGQLLLASAAVGANVAYGLWWPWGDGMTTSVRIGLGGPDTTSDRLQRLRDVFGVEV